MAMVVGCYYGNERDTATPDLQYNAIQFAKATLSFCHKRKHMLSVTFCLLRSQFEALSAV